MPTIKATITVHKWDTDGQRVKLPKKVTSVLDVDESDTLGEIHEQAMDNASDQLGWCIESCSLTRVEIC